jgi:molybdate transport system regulatory protein
LPRVLCASATLTDGRVHPIRGEAPQKTPDLRGPACFAHRHRMKQPHRTLGIRLRIVLDPAIAIGPGKADLLEGIKATGSIAAAGRRMGMSYKRAWLLVETMNTCFRAPLVETSRGGTGHGGAILTTSGEEVLKAYRRMQAKSETAIADELAALQRMLAPPAGPEIRGQPEIN